MSEPVRSEIPYSMVPEWLIEADLSDRAVRLYALLHRYANSDRAGFPSRTTLARRIRCSVDSIDRAIRELRAAGVLEANHRFDDGRQTSNGYLLRMSAPVLGEGRTTAAPEGRTDAAQIESNRNEKEPAATAADAHPSSKRKSDPRADVIVRAWWEAQDAKPMQPFVAVQQLVSRALGAGYEPDEVLAALDRCERPIVGWKLEQALTRRRAGAVRTEPTNPAARRWWEDGS
jgi:hypothetical protein